ncbi:MAG TPA: hypothetical protein VNO24_30880, partial [Blastocatellia bacterium]|nr:hypothetical protein [Blastocatellia bacterium]
AHRIRSPLGTGFGTTPENADGDEPSITSTWRSLILPLLVTSGLAMTVPPPARIAPTVVNRIVPCGT